VKVFFDLAHARLKLDKWRRDYNQRRPHSALSDPSLDEFASVAMQLSTKTLIALKGSSELL